MVSVKGFEAGEHLLQTAKKKAPVPLAPYLCVRKDMEGRLHLFFLCAFVAFCSSSVFKIYNLT